MLYTYQCDCGVQFESSASMKDASKPKPCPTCNKQAPRMMPTDVNSSFNLEVSGPEPQNTGVHDLDTHVDRVIGQSAKQGWEVADKRRRRKLQVLLSHPGATGDDLSRNPDGSYRVMKPEERAAHERANTIHSLAMQKLKEEK